MLLVADRLIRSLVNQDVARFAVAYFRGAIGFLLESRTPVVNAFDIANLIVNRSENYVRQSFL
jgi:hypothetical protein